MLDLIADRYERLAALGSGAFGDVYKVLDRETGEIRAVKVLKAGTGNVAVFARFEREYAAILRIVHPNVVRVHDFGMHGEHPYFTMEYLEGIELRAYCEEQRPAAGDPGFEDYAARIAYVFHQVADGLAAVHAEGVVHRDIKPENVFIRSGRFPRAKLLDFGHARDDDDQDLTRTGTVMGTAWYIPPEQATASGITPAADLYALGCCMYEALVGEPPFMGNNVIEVLMGHIRKPAPDAREKEPRTPGRLAELCLHMMEKDPAARPTDAATVAKALESE